MHISMRLPRVASAKATCHRRKGEVLLKGGRYSTTFIDPR